METIVFKFGDLRTFTGILYFLDITAAIQ